MAEATQVQLSLQVKEEHCPSEFQAITNAHFQHRDDGGRFLFAQEDPFTGKVRRTFVVEMSTQFIELFRANTQKFFNELQAEGHAPLPRNFVDGKSVEYEWHRGSVLFVSRSVAEIEIWVLHIRPSEVHFLRQQDSDDTKAVTPTPVIGFLLSRDVALLLLEEVFSE